MSDTMFGNGDDQWVCPNDRQLALRAKLQTGWSVHTFQTERQRKSQMLEKRELDIIMSVIHRAEQLDQTEQHRIGRLVERLENMKRSAVGNGLSQCLLCGELLGLLGTPSVLCLDCCKKVCTKCGIETMCSQKRTHWLCKICSEQREVWKRSGAWFYKALPKHVRPIKEGVLDNRMPVTEREDLKMARSAPINRTYTWAHSKVVSSESDASDSDLSECSGDRKAFAPESKQRRDSESSGGLVQTPVGFTGQTRGSFLSESHSSLGSERSGYPPVTEDEDTDHSRPSLMQNNMDSDSDSNASLEVEDHSPPSISMTEGHVQLYAFEPLAHAAVEIGAAAAESEEAPERTGEVSEWCSCGHCHRMADVRENICCRDIDKVMAKCGEVDEVVACMTAHPGFEPVCLNPWVLHVADTSYRQDYGDFEAPINRWYRHAAYHNFVQWCWGYLGKRVRVRLPACVVMGIRLNFPDPSGDYTGFKWPPL